MSTAEPFVGRERELLALRTTLTEVRSGQPRVVLVGGPAGIGKTTLVRRFLAAEDDLHVLYASGEQWEALVAYGVIDQLSRVAGPSGARVLGSRVEPPTTEEPVNVGARLLELWSDLEDQRPVATVIDDAQWADTDSLRAVLFALRRLVGERVLVLLVVRDEDESRLPEALRRLASGPIGAVVQVGPLKTSEVRALASGLGAKDVSNRVADRMIAHTAGNPLYIRSVLDQVPATMWRSWEPMLPAPRAFADSVASRLQACPDPVRRLVEAAAVLGVRASLMTVAALADVDDPLAALDAAVDVDLLRPENRLDTHQVLFPHPLVRAAVYEHMRSARRAEMHRAAADLVDGAGAALRHRVAAAAGHEPQLVAELQEFARLEATGGAWASAASALATASRLSPTQAERERLQLRAVDAMVSAGDLARARSHADEIVAFAPVALRDATLGYLAVLSGHSAEAEKRLGSAWEHHDKDTEPHLAASIAQGRALHGVARLRGQDMVEWARRAYALAPDGEPVRMDAAAILGVGLGWLGRTSEGLATHTAALDEAQTGLGWARFGGLALKMANGWLRLAVDDIVGARAQLAEAAPTALRQESNRVALYAYAWLTRAHYYTGSWDEAVVDAERALALLVDTEHEWLRPLVRWAAGGVPAARGEWAVAEEHARLAASPGDDYEFMIAAAGLAEAQLATARGDHDAVLRALTPLLEIAPRQAIDEPGFWPWQDLYGDALVSAGRVDEADEFLRPHESRAAGRAHRSMIARLARVRGRVHAARGEPEAAEAAFEHGLDQIVPLPMPFERALIELAYGQALRRSGKRRTAAAQLSAARDRLAALGARPFLERCERELVACGLSPAKRRNFDAQRLTPQELGAARLVSRGLSNRQIAAELLVSIKTVQAHLTRAYAKVGVRSRGELGAWLREEEAARDHPPPPCDPPSTRCRHSPDAKRRHPSLPCSHGSNGAASGDHRRRYRGFVPRSCAARTGLDRRHLRVGAGTDRDRCRRRAVRERHAAAGAARARRRAGGSRDHSDRADLSALARRATNRRPSRAAGLLVRIPFRSSVLRHPPRRPPAHPRYRTGRRRTAPGLPPHGTHASSPTASGSSSPTAGSSTPISSSARTGCGRRSGDG